MTIYFDIAICKDWVNYDHSCFLLTSIAVDILGSDKSCMKPVLTASWLNVVFFSRQFPKFSRKLPTLTNIDLCFVHYEHEMFTKTIQRCNVDVVWLLWSGCCRCHL